jgi:hypothetical protein
MLDKFLLFLSIEPFCAALFPMAGDRLVHGTSRVARAEISRMLGGKSNYYMIDLSAERVRLSKKEVASRMYVESVSDRAAQYVTYVMDLFDNLAEKRVAMDLVVREKVDRLLGMDFCVPSDAAFSSVQRLHQEQIYSSDFDAAPWVDMVLSSYGGPWAAKLRDSEFFDGMEDLLQGWMEEVVGSFSLFAFFGVAKSVCSQEELLALIENIEGGASSSAEIEAEIADRLLSGLRVVQ